MGSSFKIILSFLLYHNRPFYYLKGIVLKEKMELILLLFLHNFIFRHMNAHLALHLLFKARYRKEKYHNGLADYHKRGATIN